MSMLHKWATGSNKKDNTKTVTGGHDGHMEASGDFAYELPNSEPSEVAGTVGAASTPYTLEKAKQYSASGRYNPGGADVIGKKKLDWYNIMRMWKWRKIMKRRSLYGAAPATPFTKLYEA